MWKKLLVVLLICVTIFNIGTVVISHWSSYSSHNYWQRFQTLHKTYYDSVYKNKRGKFLPDEILYAYIGGALVKGESPILLNPEVPPFGTYIIGVSILIFNNEHVVSLLFAIASLVLLFLLGRQIFFHKITAFIPPLLLSFEMIFKNQLIYTPLLDNMQLVFLLTIFYVFNKAISQKTKQGFYFLLIGVFFGMFISTKFFGSGLGVVGGIFLSLLFRKDFKRLFLLPIIIITGIIILYGTYIRVLFTGYPLGKFLGIQKWIYLYNTGHLSQPFTVWPLLVLNKWYLWFGNVKVTSDSQWSISWPILTVLSFLSIVISIITRRKKTIDIVIFWVICYLGLLSFVQISSRYFVILIPFFYILVIYLLEQIVNFAKKQVQ